MKKFFKNICLIVFLSSCVQEPANIEIHKDGLTKLKEKTKEVPRPSSDSVGPMIAEDSDKIELVDSGKTDLKTVEKDAIELTDNKIKKEEENNQQKEQSKTNYKEKIHTVKKGETLFALSRKYDLPIQPIIFYNNLKSPYELNEGQKIVIPKGKFHNVKPQETLYGISRKYNVDMASIVKLNNIKPPYSLSVNQKLQIPFSEDAVIAASTKSPDARKKLVKKWRKSDVPKRSYSVSKVKPISGEPKGLAIKVAPTSKPSKLKNKGVVYKDNGKFGWPLKGSIAGSFGKQRNGEYNDGIYISASTGANVKASLSGRVVYTGDSLKSYGNLIIIKHSNGLLSAYGHLSKIKVSKDSQVKKGQVIGTVGKTGKVSSPQLYFAIRKGKTAKNPLSYLR